MLLTIPGLNNEIIIYLNTEIGIAVEYKKRNWGLLVCFDGVPVKSADDYYCALTLPEWRTKYSSRTELCRSEMFKPFLIWINNRLCTATYLGLYCTAKGSTYAELLTKPDESAAHLFNLWS